MFHVLRRSVRLQWHTYNDAKPAAAEQESAHEARLRRQCSAFNLCCVSAWAAFSCVKQRAVDIKTKPNVIINRPRKLFIIVL